jgi:hypothetical protein
VKFPLSCQCGAVQGELDAAQGGTRAVCYCKDCQAYARFLARSDEMLNPLGGTEIIAALPRAVHFSSGLERLACMSITTNGPYRWYASCCRSPIGNTPRDRKIAYLGLVRSCLSVPDDALEPAFGPLNTVVNAGSALGPVRTTPIATMLGIAKIGRNVLGARISGKYKENPFFEPGSNKPVSAPRTLTAQERATLRKEQQQPGAEADSRPDGR